MYVFLIRKHLEQEKGEREKVAREREVEMRKLGDGDSVSERGSVLGSVEERSVDGVMRDVELGGTGVRGGSGKGGRKGGKMRWWRR